MYIYAFRLFLKARYNTYFLSDMVDFAPSEEFTSGEKKVRPSINFGQDSRKAV
jgi:hypothetical protein